MTLPRYRNGRELSGRDGRCREEVTHAGRRSDDAVSILLSIGEWIRVDLFKV